MFEKKIQYFNDFIAADIIMTWENIEIDHIKPVSKFNLDDEEEFLHCCNYSNLQPLLKSHNLEKYNKCRFIFIFIQCHIGSSIWLFNNNMILM